jgi:outer membrane lipoprotein-sorting protein
MLLFGLIQATLWSQQAPDFERMLQNIDTLSNFDDEDFSSVMTMITEDPESGTDKRTVQQFRRDSEDKFLMVILEPSTQKGQSYLRVDDNMWVYDPVSRKFSHTSMKESFEDTEARNSDFRRSTIAEDYDVASYTEGRLGRFDCWVLELAATHNEVTFPYAKVWIEKTTEVVLKSEDYSLTKLLMRTSLIPKYNRVAGKYVPVQMIFIDELVEGRKTQITVSNMSTDALPDTVFSKAYVERINR